MLEYEAWLRRLARSLVMDDSRADDVVQQVWLKALEGRPSQDKDLRPWLKVVARNVAFNQRRGEIRRNKREKSASQEETLAERAFLEERETRNLLLGAVKQIQEPYRSTLLLHYYEEMSLEEIARKLRIPSATVRTRLRRGLDQIRSLLDERYGNRQSWGLMLFPVCWLGADPSWASGGLLKHTIQKSWVKTLALAPSAWGVAAVLIVAPIVVTVGLTAPTAPESVQEFRSASAAPIDSGKGKTNSAANSMGSPTPPPRTSQVMQSKQAPPAPAPKVDPTPDEAANPLADRDVAPERSGN